MAEEPLTIRQQIIQRLFAKMEAMRDINNAKIWNKVLIGDIDELTNVQVPALAIDEGTEFVMERYGNATHYTLPVFFHFKWRLKAGVANLEQYKYYLGKIQRAMLPDHNLAETPGDIYGLAINIDEESNSPATVGQTDEHPGGDLTVNVIYRTAIHDPYHLPGQV